MPLVHVSRSLHSTAAWEAHPPSSGMGAPASATVTTVPPHAPDAAAITMRSALPCIGYSYPVVELLAELPTLRASQVPLDPIQRPRAPSACARTRIRRGRGR